MTDKAVSYPELPEPADELAADDGFNVIGTQPVFTADHMRAYADQAVALFLERTGQYVTNDASREAAIAEAVDAAREQDRARAAAPQAAVGVSDEQINEFVEKFWSALRTSPTAMNGYNLGTKAKLKAELRAMVGSATKPEAPAADCGNCFEGETDRGHKCKVCGGTGKPAEAPANEGRTTFEQWYAQYHEDACVMYGGLSGNPKDVAHDAWDSALAAPAQGAAVPDAELLAEAQSEGFDTVAEYVAAIKQSKATYFAERNSARDALRAARQSKEASHG